MIHSLDLIGIENVAWPDWLLFFGVWKNMTITIVGLGPGDGRLITREGWDVLCSATRVYVRTARHPAVDELPEGLSIHPFDDIYDQTERFEDVYAAIVSQLMQAAGQSDVVYAVPGHPYVGESTVLRLVEAATAADIRSGSSMG